MNEHRNIQPDLAQCPDPNTVDPSAWSIPADPTLVAKGWTRRFLAEPSRAREAVELYSSLGYEVKAQKLQPSDLPAQCGACASTLCRDFVMIYTRKDDSPQEAVTHHPTRSTPSVHPTQCLRNEHQIILIVLSCFEIALGRARQSGCVRQAEFEPFVEFFRGFADKCHHCKEEDRLFPCLERKGIPREGGPIGVMIYEHEQGRRLVRTIAGALEAADSGDASAIRTILEHGQSYLELLRAHIGKENNVLFEMADQLVQGADLTDLVNTYNEAEKEPTYDDTYTKCRAIADRLLSEYGVSGA